MVPNRFSDRLDATGRQRFAVVASAPTATNVLLLDAARALGCEPLLVFAEDAAACLRPGDTALGRLDVLPTFDGPEPGLEALRRLEEAEGIAVLNRAGALLGAHDKLVTALRLTACSLPHPRTAHVGGEETLGLEFPVVVKPRFGSWGLDVVLCRTRPSLRRTLRALRRKPWFQRQGALVQEVVGPIGRDLRLLVAAGEVVGAIERVAAPGEWRTNVALGASRKRVVPPPDASYLAVRAAAAIGADLAGVDLLPDGDEGYAIVELNGAVDFTREYGLRAEDPFVQALRALAGRASSAVSARPA